MRSTFIKNDKPATTTKGLSLISPGIGIANFLESGSQIILHYKEDVMKTGPTSRSQLTRNKPRRKTSRDVFDTTIQKTQVWLNDLMSELDWEDKPHKTYMALRT